MINKEHDKQIIRKIKIQKFPNNYRFCPVKKPPPTSFAKVSTQCKQNQKHPFDRYQSNNRPIIHRTNFSTHFSLDSNRESWWGAGRRGGDSTTSSERRRRPGSRSGWFRRTSVPRAFHGHVHACSTFPSRTLSLHVTTPYHRV